MRKIPLVAILLSKGKSILVEIRKKEEDFGAGATWIPGGHVEKGETEDQAILRECKEEFGIKLLDCKELCKLPWQKNKKQYTIQYYQCNKWAGKIKNLEAGKLIWVKPRETSKLSENVDRKAFKKFLEQTSA